MYFFKIGISISCIVLFMAGCGRKQKEQKNDCKELTPSQCVEQASFEDLQGNTVSLSEYKGKVVLIDFWETWCRPCLASFPTMQKLMNDYPDDFVVLAVTPGFVDTKEDAQKFVSQHDYNFEFLLDKNKLHQKLQIQSIPYKVFVDAQGNFIESSMGSYGPEEDYKKVKSIIEKYSTNAKAKASAD